MNLLSGIYTPDIFPVDFSGAAVVVHQPAPADLSLAAHHGPVCIVAADVTGNGGIGRIDVEVGTWNGSTFTPIKTVGIVSAVGGDTNQVFILHVTDAASDAAIRMTASGSVIGFVRIQGKTKQVSP